MFVCVRVCVCVCVCVCVWERDREREKERQRVRACVCVCVSIMRCFYWLESGRYSIIVSKTRFYLWRDSFLCWTWLIPICRCYYGDVTHSYLQVFLLMGIGTRWYYRIKDSFLFVTRIISMWDVTHSYLQVFLLMGIETIWYYRIKDSFLCVAWLNFACPTQNWHIYIYI